MDELASLLDAPLYRDRAEAGRALAELLPDLGPRTLVVGLARGGVQVAAEVASARGWELDVVAVRKVRHPLQPEYALGAVAAAAGVFLRDDDGLTQADVAAAVGAAEREARELDRRLRAERPPLDPAGRPVVLVDDGLATGSTLIAAARRFAARAAQTVAAVPVAARQSIGQVLDEVDLLFCPHVRDDLYAVGAWYADFAQLSDADVLRLLDEAAAERAARAGAARPSSLSRGRR